MGQTAGEIRDDIEQTRSRMSGTIEALGYRLDVPARMRYRFSHIMNDVNGALGVGKADGADGGDGSDGGDLLAAGHKKVGSMLHAARSGISGLAGMVEDRLGGAGQVRQQAEDQTQQARDTATTTWRRLGGFAKKNAVVLSLGALAVGVIAGMSVPRSRMKVIRRGHQMARLPWR